MSVVALEFLFECLFKGFDAGRILVLDVVGLFGREVIQVLNIYSSFCGFISPMVICVGLDGIVGCRGTLFLESLLPSVLVGSKVMSRGCLAGVGSVVWVGWIFLALIIHLHLPGCVDRWGV
jgi:hypothetical protein